MSDLSHLRCHDCAFTAGTQASKCAITRVQARLCAEVGEPFFCHVNEPSLCAGYIEAAMKLHEKGFVDGQPEWRQAVRRAVLDVIHFAAHGLIDTEGDELPRVMRMTVERRLAEIHTPS